eukprot:2470759-Alexandrium_andersonii.AAC.1
MVTQSTPTTSSCGPAPAARRLSPTSHCAAVEWYSAVSLFGGKERCPGGARPMPYARSEYRGHSDCLCP